MYFEDLQVGQKFRGTSLTVTEAHIVEFGSITGDRAWLHFNEEMASKTPFGGRIAHGMLTASLAMPSIVPILGDEAVTHLSDTFTYRDPVLIGDTITTECEIADLQRKTKWGLLRIRYTTRTQKGNTVMEGETVVGVRYKPQS